MGIGSQFTLTNPVMHDGEARIYSLDEMLKFPPPEWLIPGLVPRGGIVGLAGPPGVGKSMLALDWALCVGSGMPWLDRPIQKEFALYIAAEGHSGLQSRAASWLRHHNILPRDISFGLVKGRVQMVKDNLAHEAVFTRIEQELEVTPGLVVIDTLARTVAGDENHNEVMDQFMTEAERWVENYGATVLILHHKNAGGTRERGHTSFRGTVSTLFFLDPVPRDKGLLRLSCEKQRDAREADPIGLRMDEVEGTGSVVLREDVLP
jgi:RecA-family ATPase